MGLALAVAGPCQDRLSARTGLHLSGFGRRLLPILNSKLSSREPCSILRPRLSPSIRPQSLDPNAIDTRYRRGRCSSIISCPSRPVDASLSLSLLRLRLPSSKRCRHILYHRQHQDHQPTKRAVSKLPRCLISMMNCSPSPVAMCRRARRMRSWI